MTKSAQNVMKYLIFGAVFVLFAMVSLPFLASTVFAAFFAVTLYPVFGFFSVRLKLGENLGAFIVLILTLVFIFAPILALLSLVTGEVLAFINSLDQEAIADFLSQNSSFDVFGYNIDFTSMQEKVLRLLQDSAAMIYEFAIGAGAAIGNYIFLFIVFIFLYFFFLKDGELIVEKIKKLMPFEDKQNRFLMKELSNTAKTVFVGNLGTAVISGVMAYLAFAVLGLRGALVWALLVAILSLIPAIGSLVIYVIAGVVLGLLSGWHLAAILLVYYVLVEVLLLQNVIRPRMLEEKFGVHPILVFFGLVGGVMLFKSAGVLYGPLIIVAFVTILDFMTEGK